MILAFLNKYDKILKYCLSRTSWSVGQGVKTPRFHRGNTGSNPVRTINHKKLNLVMEDYPSPAEGNGLENRQAGKTARGFESHILLVLPLAILYYRGMEQLGSSSGS